MPDSIRMSPVSFIEKSLEILNSADFNKMTMPEEIGGNNSITIVEDSGNKNVTFQYVTQEQYLEKMNESDLNSVTQRVCIDLLDNGTTEIVATEFVRS